MATSEATPVLERKRNRFVDSVRLAVFVIGTGAVCIVALRNSLTWSGLGMVVVESCCYERDGRAGTRSVSGEPAATSGSRSGRASTRAPRATSGR